MIDEKRIEKITDSWFGYSIGSFFLATVGGLIGMLITGIPLGIYAGLAYGDKIAAMTGGAREIITGLTGLIPDWIITGQAYLTSIGIWLFALLWFRRKANKPI